MGLFDKLGCNGYNSLQFDQLRKTVSVHNKNKLLNDNSVNNVMPVVVNNDLHLNSCGGGKLSNFISQNIWQDIHALDTVPHVNMTNFDSNVLIMNSHNVLDSNICFAPQHGSASVIKHMEATHHPFPRNHGFQSYHSSVHKTDRFNYTYFDYFYNSANQLVYINNYPQNKLGCFYFFKFSCETGKITIFECLSHPMGALHVCGKISL